MPGKIAKFIESLTAKEKKRLKEKLVALKKNPFHGHDVKKMKSSGEDIYRLRLGKIRIIYRLHGQDVEIIDIDYRGNMY